MSDLTLSVKVSRDRLGLGSLEINDHLKYYIGATFLGGNVQWNRNTLESPYLDGSITLFKTRSMVTDTVTVEVLGKTGTLLNTNLQDVVRAFTQDSFTLTVAMDGVTKIYDCESADYTVTSLTARSVARQLQVSFSVPRRPLPVSGVV